MAKHSSRLRFLEYRRRAPWRIGKDDPKDAKPRLAPLGGGGHRSLWRLVREFAGLLRGHRPAMFVALGTLTVSTLMKLVPPAVTKLVIDNVLPGKPLPPAFAERFHLPAGGWPLLVALGGVVFCISLSAVALSTWGRWMATVATKRLQVELRKRVFEHAVHLPLHRVYAIKSGGVASILREDAGGVGDLIFSMLYNPWRAVIQLLGSLAVLAWVDWRLLLGSLLVIPTVYFTHRTWIGRIRPQYREIRRQRQEIDSHATEAFGGMRVVRAFGRSRSETGRFTRGGHLMARHELLAWWWVRGVELVWAILIPAASAALLMYGGSQVLSGELSIGELMMFLVYLAMLLEPVAVLAETATALQNNLAGLDRVFDLLDEPLEMPAEPGALQVQPETTAGRIALRGVSFHYPNTEHLVLRGIDLEAKPGQMIALVGPSGAGKTTLCNLVARFYDPTAGSIELDGVDLRGIDVESYRRLVGIVEQDIFLFDGTIAENIGYASRRATLEQIEQAARLANAHEFVIALPDGYDTMIGERGVRLSGGQRQRLAIARAMLADPRIFILDEATSNLDTESERLIQQSLRVLLRGRTSFVIAHRLSTIMHADLILVLVDGQIVERGSHEQLMAKGRRYRAMVEMQMGPAAGAAVGLDAPIEMRDATPAGDLAAGSS
ncbi:MAG TPA: ABC transporter ATP-binding protein [Pirellulales bacterium]|jgi:ATP-binding cassette subfamily B protein/subfamily B ATP-binding cassette protein MsbA